MRDGIVRGIVIFLLLVLLIAIVRRVMREIHHSAGLQVQPAPAHVYAAGMDRNK